MLIKYKMKSPVTKAKLQRVLLRVTIEAIEAGSLLAWQPKYTPLMTNFHFITLVL